MSKKMPDSHTRRFRVDFTLVAIALTCTPCIGDLLAQEQVETLRESPAELLKSILQQRMAIRQYHCLVAVYGEESTTLSSTRYRRLWELFGDGSVVKGMRWENVDASTPQAAVESASKHLDALGAATVLCRNCYLGSGILHFRSSTPESVDRSALSVYGIEDSNQLLEIPNARILGVYPQPLHFGSGSDVDEFFIWGKDEVKRSEVAKNGISLIKLFCSSKKDASVTYWIDPARDNLVAEVLFEFRGANSAQIKQLMTTDYKQYEDELWLPVGYKLVRSRNARTELSEEAAILWLSVNKELPKDTFSIRSFGVPPDTPVNWTADNIKPPGNPARLVWNGEQIIEGQLLTDGDYQPLSGHSLRGWIIGANIAVFIVCVIAILLRYRNGST